MQAKSKDFFFFGGWGGGGGGGGGETVIFLFFDKESKSIMPPDLVLVSTLIGANYPCLQLLFMVPEVFEPLKFHCIFSMWSLLIID